MIRSHLYEGTLVFYRYLDCFTLLCSMNLSPFTNSPSHSILRCLLPSNAPVCTQVISPSSVVLPLFHVQFLGVQLVVLRAHLLSRTLAIWPAHLQFFDFIVLIISCTLDFFLRSSFVTLFFFVYSYYNPFFGPLCHP